jgi:hypothetical protein
LSGVSSSPQFVFLRFEIPTLSLDCGASSDTVCVGLRKEGLSKELRLEGFFTGGLKCNLSNKNSILGN